MKDRQDHDTALVLVTDDDPAHRALVREALEKAGYAVEEASSGEEGLRIAEHTQPDIILLDLMMPRIDGYTVCSELRRNPQFKDLPIIMVTALDDIGSIEQAFEAGATNFITKPINWTLLPFHVKYMLRASWTEDELRKTKALLEAARASA